MAICPLTPFSDSLSNYDVLSHFLKFFGIDLHSGKSFNLFSDQSLSLSLKMSDTEGQRAASPPSVHISWTSDECDVVKLNERPKPSTAIIPVHG